MGNLDTECALQKGVMHICTKYAVSLVGPAVLLALCHACQTALLIGKVAWQVIHR